MDFTNYLSDKLVNATVRNIGYTTPVKVYLALFKTDPTKEAIGIEVTGASYTRPNVCLLYTSPSPRDAHESRMPSSA